MEEEKKVKRRKPPPMKDQKKEKEIIVQIPYRLPVHINLSIEAHDKWMAMVERAERLNADDYELQNKAKKGLMIKGRSIPPEILGRLYAEYCTLINDMYDAYLNNLQLQRMEYIEEIVSILVKRMFELRNELVHIVVNDYIYVDSSLKQLLKTPFDIEIVVPYHFAKDSRPGSIEELFQKMWKDAVRRKERAMRPPKPKPLKPIYSNETVDVMAAQINPKPEEETQGEELEEEEVEEEEEEEDEESGIVRSETYLKINLIQRHERFRWFFLRDFVIKCDYRRRYFRPEGLVEATPEMKHKAASLIQKIYRKYMDLKREHVRIHKRDVLLGIVPDVNRRPLKFREENEKVYEIRRQKRLKLNKAYLEQMEKERTRLLFWGKGEDLKENITKEIREWFEEWYLGYDYFPQFPYQLEGGTLLVVRGQYPTIDEQREDDEKYKRATKGKSKDQIAEEKKQAKEDAERKLAEEKERIKKEKEAYFKARCNPMTDPGYQVLMSENNKAISEALRRYRMAWSFYDHYPLERCGEVIYGFMKPLITEKVMEDMHYECRKVVDEIMRLELKLFIKAQKMMFERVSKLWPKQRMRKRPKPVKILPPFEVDKYKLKSVEPIFDLGIMSKPTSKLNDIMGDLNFRNYEANIADPSARFPNPGYGDVRRRLVLSCIFGSGIDPNAPRKRSVMLMGLPRNGKSFLVDCVAGEMNAVKFDITPAVFSAKVKKPAVMLRLVFMAARIFQPSVIFCKNIEQVFYKKVAPSEKNFKASRMKAPLTKLMKTIPVTEKIIFIGTCSDPFVAKQRPMFKLFDEVIVVPKPDYGTLQRFFYDKFQSIHSMPRDFCVQGLATCMQGIGFGLIIEILENVLTPERICKLNITPLQQHEFIEYMIVNDIEAMDSKDYQKMVDLWLKFSPLKAEREQYQIINTKRFSVYKRLAEIQAEKEAKAAAKLGKK